MPAIPRLAALALCLLALATRASAAAAPETRVLAELDGAAEWAPASWTSAQGQLSTDGEFPPALAAEAGPDARSLKLSVRWRQRGEFLFFSCEPRAKQRPIPYRVSEIALWVKGSGTQHSLEAHFDDANGKEVKVGLGSTAAMEWRRVAGRIPADCAQPLALRSIVLHNWSAREPADTVLHVTRLEAVVDAGQTIAPGADMPAFGVSPEAANGLASPEGRVPVLLRVSRWSREEKALEIRQQLADWEGKALPLERIPVSLRGTWSRRLEVALPACGAFTYTAELVDPAQAAPLATIRRRLTRVVPAPRLNARERAASPMGVNVHLGSPIPTLGRLGIHWARDYSWGWLGKGETAPIGQGQDFGDLFKAADAAGVTILPITQAAFRNPSNTGFLSDGAAIRAAYTRLAKAFPEVPYWELDNEAELSFPGHRFDLANYRNLIRSAAGGVRAAGQARVALNGTAGIRYEDTVSLLKSPVRDDFAVVNYHYYTGTVPPETCTEDINAGGGQQPLSFADQLRRINRLAHAAGKEAWLTEIGWDVTNGPAVGERLQAVYLPRVFLLSRLCGTDKVFWYFDRDVPNSTLRFSTCGLVDLAGDLRPSAAALAALSQQTAFAEVGGSVDLGDDRWCVLLKRPEGRWVAAVWSVAGRHPLPKELGTAPALDLFGNPFRPREIAPEIAYFQLDKLPAAWEAQRRVEWLSPATLLSGPGNAVRVELRSPDPATAVTWEGLPAGVSAGAWQREGDRLVCRLACAPDFPAGRTAMRAVARGAGWQRRWNLALAVVPPVRAEAAPYTPGQVMLVTLRPAGEEPAPARVEAPLGRASVLPSDLTLDPERGATLALLPAADARGPLPLEVKLASGARQSVWLRPLSVEVARVGKPALDGSLSGWNEKCRWESRCLTATSEAFPGEIWAGWSEEGLWIGARVKAGAPKPTNPREFWEGSALELFVDPAGEALEGWSGTAHQFWFCPVREGNAWRLSAGEWKRGEAIPETIFEDQRCRTAIRMGRGEYTFEALIPAAALGGPAPKAGQSWRLALSLRHQDAAGSVSGSWPRAKDEGILEGTAAWGIIRLVD